MFFSVLYLLVLLSILIFTVLAIRAVLLDRPILPWLLGLAAATGIYLLAVGASILF
ncbi:MULTISPECIES: hypothetical protein [Thermoactinomyces]|jgi:hypothetical protein|uniref:Uncharacterized protein n=1 Tax=Thermoactinomyces daqus TaxID=1329516 RepID=A0A7W2AJ44_9BACL|nr:MULTISPECIES: hypothetical protein [Thermoactinomyces]MBA4543568.1 hypothetical protein [Thermoactinomyces daqus]MBH8596570.1 hypothetical protein [Thermoactinomyces sp. CICC 10523]MBH8603332.1 hypothetical protein [Thermoactinomyces sp. CICC 10522]MBH8607901.1 hypothetical protein [Thermoactinomyces sp. CICC 10521]